MAEIRGNDEECLGVLPVGCKSSADLGGLDFGYMPNNQGNQANITEMSQDVCWLTF